VIQYEETHIPQSTYRELKKYALRSTAAQLSGGTLLQYITTSRYFPPKLRFRMLQNAVGDVTELAYAW
jgi:hypothetical protein